MEFSYGAQVGGRVVRLFDIITQGLHKPEFVGKKAVNELALPKLHCTF